MEYNGVLPLYKKRKLPHVAAVYHVLDGQRVVYIGRTNSLWGRWNTGTHHHLDKIKALADPRIAWYVVDKGNLVSTEREHIARYNPPLNVRPRPNHVQEIFDKYIGVDLATDYTAWSSLQQELTR